MRTIAPVGTPRRDESKGGYTPLLDGPAVQVEVTEDNLRQSLVSMGEEESDMDVVQFATAIWYATQDEGVATLTLMRIGSLRDAVSVEFSTLDGSAKAGTEFEYSSGTVTLVDGQDVADIEIPILKSEQFSTTTEFHVALSMPTDCSLGHYLKRVRVKVIGSGVFPSSKYEEQLLAGRSGIDQLGGWHLWLEAMKFIYYSRGIRWRTMVTSALHQVENIYLFMKLSISVYLVDVLFDEAESPFLETGPRDGRIYTAYLIAFVYVFPTLLTWLCAAMRSMMNLEEKINTVLKLNLFNKFLNYSEESRQDIGQSRMQDSVYQECNKITSSYMTMMQMIFIFGKVLILAAFTVQKTSANTVLTAATMPVIMLTIAAFRAPITRVAASAVNKADLNFLVLIQDSFKFYSTIKEYSRRPQILDYAQERLSENEKTKSDLAVVVSNNSAFSDAMAPAYIAYHLIRNTEKVLSGEMAVGVFITVIAVYVEFSAMWAQVYTMFMAMSGSHGAIKNIAETFNMKTDLKDKMQVHRNDIQELKNFSGSASQRLRRRQAAEEAQDMTPAIDKIPIELRSVSFQYQKQIVLDGVDVSLSQGSIVAVCGAHGSGKSTLMRILAGLEEPEKGMVLIPVHLRCLYVPATPTLLKLSVWDNLTFGNQRVAPARVMSILQDIGVTENLQGLVRHDLHKLGRLKELPEKEVAAYEQSKPGQHFTNHWQTSISSALVAKLHICRALIMNPEVLILQRPLAAFDLAEKVNIIKMLKTHVNEKGCSMPAKSINSRRPRTIIFGPSDTDDLKIATTAWMLDETTKRVVERDPGDLLAQELKVFGLGNSM